MSDLVGNPEDRFSRVAAQVVFKLLESTYNSHYLKAAVVSRATNAVNRK